MKTLLTWWNQSISLKPIHIKLPFKPYKRARVTHPLQQKPDTTRIVKILTTKSCLK